MVHSTVHRIKPYNISIYCTRQCYGSVTFLCQTSKVTTDLLREEVYIILFVFVYTVFVSVCGGKEKREQCLFGAKFTQYGKVVYPRQENWYNLAFRKETATQRQTKMTFLLFLF